MIEVIDNLSSMRALEPQWQRLGSQFDSPLLQFDWFLSCAEHLHSESNLRVFIVRAGDQVKAIAPLVLAKQSIASWLELLGSSTLYEPGGLLYEDQQSLDTLLGAVMAAGYPVNLGRIPDASPITTRLQALASRRTFMLVRPSAGSYHITADSDWDTFYSNIGKKWRADFRNKKRRAEKMGNIAIDTFRPTVDQLETLLEQAMDIEAHSWKGKQGSSIRDNHRLLAFMRAYAERSCKSGILIIFFFRINDKPVAMNLGITYGNKMWFLKTGYNEDWSRVSPGMQLNMECMHYAFQHGFTGYEFLGSEEAWQRAWPVKSHKYSSIILLPYTGKGILGFSDIVLTYAKNRLRKDS